MKYILLPVLLLAVAPGIRAATPAASIEVADLPPAALARRLILSSPEVTTAGAMLEADQARRDRLAAGDHETQLRFEGARRRVDPAGDRFREWTVSLERPLRLPGKVRLDRELGEEGVAVGRLSVADARHEAGRRLLRGWFAWLRESAATTLWEAQAADFSRLFAATRTRLKAGDASRLEAMQVDAAQAQARAQALQARGRAEAAAAELAAQFPGIDVSRAVMPAAPTPRPAAEGIAALVDHNHELALAAAETRRARTLARRLAAERVPDPTLGLRLGSEIGGDQRIVGISITLPLPGEARAASSRGQEALAVAAGSQEAAARRRAEAAAAALVAQARAATAAWREAEAAANQSRTAARLLERAQTLGEAGLAEVILARRQAHEAELQALAARVDAREADLRIRLDIHALWDFDDAEDAPGGATMAADLP
ncbi:MAG: TolC family protein [Proteobacteria bacterium]|nr:TolC family protein [Pseudomonadota bacterium]HQR03604.1 TolC family protein [Rhodocyclaceae bacterium]